MTMTTTIKNNTLQEVAAMLQAGNKYTLASITDFGFPYQQLMTLVSATVEPYAQYKEPLVIKFKKPRGRSVYAVRFYGPLQEFIIWEGHVKPNTEMYGAPEAGKTPGVTVRTSRYKCFDIGYMVDAMKSLDVQPFAVYGMPESL